MLPNRARNKLAAVRLPKAQFVPQLRRGQGTAMMNGSGNEKLLVKSWAYINSCF